MEKMYIPLQKIKKIWKMSKNPFWIASMRYTEGIKLVISLGKILRQGLGGRI